ncbi:hypothetical protein ACFO3O_09375 [Dokdonia ponticola]|uniref:Glycosyltransferase family 1 protein n=1 Tax=Dokdonia ponticola TaxID=2041041 RepID=A0ABV9HYK8_9FLAO
MPNKKCILIIGDAVANTGFARVIYEIFYPLKDRYRLVQLGTNYFGDPHTWPWEIFPADVGSYSMGAHRIKDLVSNLRPDVIFMLQDPWALVSYFKELEEFPHIPTVVYASFNAADIDPLVLPWLGKANYLVVYTQFAKAALEKALQKQSDLVFPSIDVLPHGVDTDIFKPLGPDRSTSQKIAREAIYPKENNDLQNGFIVLNANRNQPRKRIDLTMEGFALFVKDKPSNVFLHLHMGLKDIGWDIKALEKRYQLEDRLIYSTDLDTPPNVSQASLNTIFNAASVGINTASSEGWGLLSFEQAAAGLAQIVPDHTSGRELWCDSAYLLPYTITLINPDTKINEHIIHPEDIALALEKAWSDKNDLALKEQLCYKNATKAAYNWARISKQWEVIIEDQLSILI